MKGSEIMHINSKKLLSLILVLCTLSSTVSASADFGFGTVNLETGEVSQDEADASTVYPTYQPQDIGNLKGFYGSEIKYRKITPENMEV